ncbi:hypothetical protein BABINDRAFT_159949 [Babjeviella inositovora NRRL Y-12698]|uniref:Vacuolar protein-sorting-associated protein 24 n=1 Tax=Babjeviella inositovora NRRL Y-12698 TaxID=984486 RepID=A0A1E3QX88_9ASCO|nr:uncharacterized protein BABINDRAFT_159949 [Babjeviella inositovora NRRL Y-12698]ODQ81692.1 hypothetical protein BABINDRAFT_159949 [Babjeviella inositovora NRRL Y-12698]
MDYVKKAIWGPDPKEQLRSCNTLIRKNKRQLDRELATFPRLEKQTEALIKQHAKKGDTRTVRMFARELLLIRNQKSRMLKSKAQLESIGMKVNEQFAAQKIQKTMVDSTVIMRDVNQLIHIPALSNTMRELERELMKSGVINEMVDDQMDMMNDEEEEEANEEEINAVIDKIVAGVMGDKLDKVAGAPSTELGHAEEEPADTVDEDQEALNEMRERLRALQS